jgi:hypothetical protein
MSADNKFTPRSLTASEYVRELFGPDDNAAILVRNRSTGHTIQTIAKAEIVAGPEFQVWLEAQSASGYEIRHVYLDLDRNGDEGLKAIRDSTETPAPNFVLDTSPGKHQVVWKVSGFRPDEAESLLHNLASKFGGDLAATDSTRVLRLPGFANQKLSTEFIVHARQESDAIYTLHDFTIDEDSPETPRRLGDSRRPERKVPSDHKSQSERDWAYAKRALSRGDDPELVIRRIADYRADDKNDPNYYARHTVEKAQAHLQRVTDTVGTKDSRRIESHQPSEDHREIR